MKRIELVAMVFSFIGIFFIAIAKPEDIPIDEIGEAQETFVQESAQN